MKNKGRVEMKQIEALTIDKLKIILQRKSIKNMYLKVKPNGEIIVTAPNQIPIADVIQFVKRKQAWIDQKQKEFSQTPNRSESLMPSEILKVGELTVKVERKRIKNMYLKVKSTGEIIVSAHPEIDGSQILEFLKIKQSWLEQKQAKFQQLPSQNLKEDEILFLGKPLKCIQKWGEKFEVEIKEHHLFVYTPQRFSYHEMFKRMEPWLLGQLQDKIKAYYEQYWPYFAKLGFQPVQIKYRQMKSTWGVCRPTRATLTFSKQLIHQPVAFIEYVVVHELCHLLHPNHSDQFYETVSTLLPQWKEAVKNKV